MVTCEYFTTNIVKFNKPLELNYVTLDSFVAYMCLEGSFAIESDGNEAVEVSKGETVLIPASLNELSLIPSSEATLLEVYVK